MPTPATIDQEQFPSKFNSLVQKIITSRKYQSLGIPVETVQDLVLKSSIPGLKDRELEKIVRQKLHNIVAPYLEDLDYPAAKARLSTQQTENDNSLKEFCLKILSAHASTKERIPIMKEFYASIFEHTGTPASILDLACGLNPFALPWMRTPSGTIYHAYDIHQPRIDLINTFLEVIHRPPLAEKLDILVNPPAIQADVAFFFKEAHRFEQRQHGCNRTFWQALNVKFIIVTLPAYNLTGSRSMMDGQRILVEKAISGLNWQVREILLGNEIIFCIKKES